MKRYLLFAGQEYACTGWAGFRIDADTIEDAQSEFMREEDDFGHVVDIETQRIVSRWSYAFNCWKEVTE